MRLLMVASLIMVWLCAVLPSYAKEPSLSGLNNIEQITLHLTYKQGTFEGYLVFHDASGAPRRIVPPFACRKSTQNPIPYLFARQYKFAKPLDINVAKFKHYSLGKKFVYAYQIPPFFVEGLEKGGKVVFDFEWCDLKVQETVFVLE